MDLQAAKNIVKATLQETLGSDDEVADDMPLIGDGAKLDSMRLVEVCLALEDEAADRDFEFDWTSDAAMSRSRSMFRTVATLAEEFSRQANA